ncbi:MAG: hypothetical protein JNK85_14085 [Verrucomicrobiales bacterium]|nr:hypothetical protein [Verrucomicrobiales bacterium]
MALLVATQPTRAGMPAAAAPTSDGPLFVALDQERYQSEPLGSSFRVRVVLSPVPAGGIVSYGVTLKFDFNAFDLVTPTFEVPAELNFNGFEGPGTFQESGPGYVSVKGTVDLLSQAVVRYDAAFIASIVLAPKNVEPGESSLLTLEPFYTAGPEEALYVAGDGRVLDPSLIFRSAVVDFVPEPRLISLLGLGAAVLAVRKGRRGAAVGKERATALPVLAEGGRAA